MVRKARPTGKIEREELLEIGGAICDLKVAVSFEF